MNTRFVIAAGAWILVALASSCAEPPATPPKVATTAKDVSRPPRGIDAEALDRGVDPCTDFYAFANGAWRRAHPIPAPLPRWSRRYEVRAATKPKLQAILEEVSAKTDWPAGSAEQIIGDHYAACLDEAAVEAAGLTPLAPLLADIDAVKKPADVQRIIRRLHDLAIPVAFAVTGTAENSEPARYVANIGAGGLGMPDRDDYLRAGSAAVERREKYRGHVTRLLALGGTPDSAAREGADAILKLETRLAGASLDGKVAADPAATEHATTFAQLKDLAPHLDWDAYFDEAKLPRVPSNVAEPKLLQQLDKEIEQTPVATWKLYLRYQLLDSASPWLPSPFATESFEFKDRLLGGAAEMKPRAVRCVDSTEALFAEPLGKKYVERYFPPAARARARDMARTLLGVLQEDVLAVPWMTAETKKKATAKLAILDIELGYPDTWKDHRGVTVRRDALWANVVSGRRFGVDDVRAQVGKPTDRKGWLLPPSSIDAYLDPQLGELVLPAGFLQTPLFDSDASDAVNFGAFGAGLAHDMTHSVDATGAELDVMGRPRPWWTPEDRSQFQARARCIRDQYEGYFIEPGVHHDGKRVLNEAIGDMGGIHLAYLALEKSMRNRPLPTIEGFTPEQQFFIAWGQLRGEAVTIEAQREIVATDSHPVPKFRVIGPLASLPEFQQAFACKDGSPMVRPAETRCSVW